MQQLVLSLFPGIGLLDRAFEEEGFCVVRGPDLLWGGDIRSFHPPAGKFDGVIGGPPCQAFSGLANLLATQGRKPRFGNLIPEFERCVREARPAWFLMENVTKAPLPEVGHDYGCVSFLLANEALGGEQDRVRRFSFGRYATAAEDLRRFIQPVALMMPARSPTVTQAMVNNSAEAKGRVRHPTVTGRHAGRQPKGGHGMSYKLPDANRLQGLPEDFLAQAPFTAEAKLRMVANGVPLPMGRAVAKAVKRALNLPQPHREIAPRDDSRLMAEASGR